MKRIISSVSAFALAFSLFGMPAMAFASDDAQVTEQARLAEEAPSADQQQTLPEGAAGPVKADASTADAEQDGQQKDPVYNEEADGDVTPASPSTSDEEEPSLLDSIIGFFTGANADEEEGADEAVSIDKSRTVSGASLEVTLHTSLPTATNAADGALTLTVGQQSAEFAATEAAGTRYVATISGISPGSQTVTVEGPNRLTLTHTIEFKDGTKHAFDVIDVITGLVDGSMQYAAEMPYGDFDGSGALDDEDSRLISEAYVQQSSDLVYDLSDDLDVTLRDVQLFAAQKGREAKPPTRVTESPDSSQTDPDVPEGTSVLLNGQVVTGAAADAALAQLLNGGGAVVGLTDSANVVPGAEKQPVSAERPVKLDLNANGALMDRITLRSPTQAGEVGASMPLAGTLTLAFEMDGEDHQVTLPIPCDSAFEADSRVLPDLSAEVNRAAGFIHINLGANVKAYDMSFTFTQAAGPDNTLVQLSKIDYAATGSSGPDEPGPVLPTPLPNIPEGFTIAKVDDGLIQVAWDAVTNAVEYKVEVTQGTEAPEVRTTTATSLKVQTFGGQPLENGTQYTLRVCAVDAQGAESGWTDALTAVPELTTPPANPGAPTLKPGYQEITATWNAVDRADSYTVFYAQAGSAEYRQIQTQDTKLTVRYLENETDYTFYVVANNRFGSSNQTGTPPRVTARTTYTTTKVPWYNLINRTVQDSAQYLPSDVFKMDAVTAGGSTDEGAKLVDGNYNTVCTLTEDGQRPTWDHGDAAKVVFRSAHNIREMALSTDLGEGFADDIEEVSVRILSGSSGRTTTTFTKANGLTWTNAPTRDGSTDVATNTIMITLPNVVANVTQVEVLFTRTNDASVTISELAFYEALTFQESIEALFKPDSFKTELAAGVNEEAIASLRSMLDEPDADTPDEELYWNREQLLDELDLAADLLKGQDARVVTTYPEIHGSSTLVRGTNAWQPLGAVAYAGNKVRVIVSPASPTGNEVAGSGTKLRLIYTQNYGSESAYMQSLGYLNLGMNSFTMPAIGSGQSERGGALYVEYEDANCPAYEVKALGAQEVPLLDLYGVTGNSQIKQACINYAAELEAYASQVQAKHAEGKHTEAYRAQGCIANATEILMDNVLISVPATLMTESFAKLKQEANVDGASALAQGLPFTDKMVTLLYQQAGLFDVSDAANASVTAQYGRNNARPATHMGFRYMMAGTTGVVTADTVGLSWYPAMVLGVEPSISTSVDGRYVSGEPYNWDFSRLVASAVTTTEQELPQVLTDYYAQLITSKDKCMQGESPAQHFSYDDVTAYLSSGAGAKLDALPKNLGIAVLWQLHLAYDEGYSYTVFDSADQLMEGSLFARMNAYVRNPSISPAGLNLEDADADNAFVRLACAASGKNLMPFFDAWRIPVTAETRAYAETFANEPRQIQYMNDDARKNAVSTAQTDVAQVAATVHVAEPNENGEVLISDIALKDEVRAGSNLGFEVLSQVGSDESTREVVGFVPAGQSTYVDRLTADNGQTLTYYVRAVDTALNRSDVTEAGEVQADFARNLNKAYWTVSSTMNSTDDPASIVDGSVDTVYRGERSTEAAGVIGGATSDPNAYASVTIAFGKATDACGIRYFPGAGAEGAFKRLWVQVSNDGVNWTSVGYKELGEDAFAASSCATVYFTKSLVMPSAAASEGAQITVQNAAYLRVSDLDTAATTPISIAEIDVIGSLPDALSYEKVDGGVQGVGVTSADVRVKAAADGAYEGAETVIPEGSLVFSGAYTGNPAKSTIVLRDALGAEVSQDAQQVILAERDLGNSISYSASGTWLMFFEPGTWEDAASTWSFVSAELYRASAAGQREGAVMTASCPSEHLPLDDSGQIAPLALSLEKWM